MSATRHPWMKFYAADWRADQALRMCSLAGRGLWIECMAIMHEADPYGYLTINGASLDSTGLARLVGSDISEVETLVDELEKAGVFSRNRAETIYSRRMIRDEKKAKIARKVGKTGGNPNLRKQRRNSARDNPPVNRDGPEGVNTQKPEARSQTPEKKEPPNPPEEGETDFEIWYAAYPRHVAPGAAEKAYRKARKIADTEILLAGIETYRQTKPDYADWKYPATWLNGKCWLDEAGTNTSPNGSAEPYRDEGQEYLRQDWTRLRDFYGPRHFWLDDWGPKPDEDGCGIAAEVMAKYGPGGSETLTPRDET